MSAEMTMRCEDVAPYLSAFADGELPEPLRSEVAEHVASCDVCTETLSRYAKVDMLFAGLPRSAPPPETLDNILAAVAAEEQQTERHQAVWSAWGFPSVKRALTRLDMPDIDRPSPRRIRPTRRAQWVSIAIPAIAALLLISVTLVTFHWLPSKGQIFRVTDQPTVTPASASATLADTRRVVNARLRQLAFKPVLPSYLPEGAVLSDVKITPLGDAEIGDHMLDIYWSISGSAQMIHLREAPAKIGLPGYSDLPASEQVAWQIGNAPWRSARLDAAPKNMAIQQHRAGIAVALDVTAQMNSAQAASGQTLLRLISLSMDSPYTVMPAAPDNNSARIVPLQVQQMVAHYTAVALNTNGAVAWREDVYVAPCASVADPCQVRISYALGSDGPVLYTDIASGQRLLHRDEALKTYSWQPRLPADQGMNLNSTALPKLFYLANTYLDAGILWYIGETSYNSERVYDLLWTNAPTRTHVYVSATTHQVVAMAVDGHARIQAGGPIAGTGALSCIRYTMFEYLTPSATTDAQFAQAIPRDFTQTQTQGSESVFGC